MNIRPKPSVASFQSGSEHSQHSLESFNIEPNSPERQKAGFLTGLWRAVGRATTDAVNNLPFSHVSEAVSEGHFAFPNPANYSELPPTEPLPIPNKQPVRSSLEVDKVSLAGSIDSLDSELSTTESVTSYFKNEKSVHRGGVDDLEKNKSSLKLIRRMRNIRTSGITKDYWMRDDKVKECYECKQPFTTFRRKHHCRICGQIFCHPCASSIVPGERFGYPGEMRVCNFCMKIMQDYRQDDPGTPQPHTPGSANHFPPPLSYVAPLSRKRSQPGDSTTTTTTPHGSIPNSGQLPMSAHKNWNVPPSPDASLENLKKMIGSSIFPARRPHPQIVVDEVSTPTQDSAQPFRGAADAKKQHRNSDSFMDPEIAEYITDEENGGSEDWATTFVPSTASGALVTSVPSSRIPVPTVNNGISDSDTYDYGDTRERKRRTPKRMLRNDELRIEFSKDKLRRRSMSTGHPRPTRFSARAISHQISKSALQSPAIDFLPFSGEDTAAADAEADDRRARTESSPPNVELNAASLAHLRALLNQALRESDVNLDLGWEDVLMTIMLKVCDNVQPDVRNGDFIDIRHYVKIKKIPGGIPADSEYICGVVCTKNVAHKRMVRTIFQPKILLLTFALEYQRVEKQYLSLEPLLSQEREHLQNLVSRVVALKPDVVLVEKTVSRLALDFLLEANVVVAYMVKPSVIEAIARCTKGDIISSMDKLALEPKLGTCEAFSIKTFVHPNIPGSRKSYMYFSGCPRELGCTITLRGGTMEQLAKIKQIADLMAFVVYNLKLETFLFRDEFAMEPAAETRGESTKPLLPAPDGVDQTEMVVRKPVKAISPFARVIRPYEQTILSASPHVKFPLPYLLARLKDEDQQIMSLHKKFAADRPLPESAPDSKDAIGAEEREYILEILEQSSGWLSSIETRAGINNLLENAVNLSPFGHQSIVVLYSNVCASTSVPCQAPEQHLIEYYRGTDMTLGQYLEELCLNSEYLCPAKLCDRKMLLHFRSYAHGQGRVNVVIEEFKAPVPGMEDTILMWSFCKLCDQVTPVVPMSDETWKYSFGKYLELSYYHEHLACRADMCPHNILRDHIRYFALKNLAVRFEYEMIELLEVVVPPKRLRVLPEIAERLMQQDYDALKDQIAGYFDSVSERLKSLTLDIIPPGNRLVAKDAMADMAKRAGSEKKYMLQLLQQTLVSSTNSDLLALNSVLRVLQEKVVQWDADFNTFARKYLQSDTKEIRRVTAAQLKRMFADRDAASSQRQGIGPLPEETAPPLVEIEMGTGTNSTTSNMPLLGSSPTSSSALLLSRVMAEDDKREAAKNANSPSMPEDLQAFTKRRMSVMLMRNTAPIVRPRHRRNISSFLPPVAPTADDNSDNDDSDSKDSKPAELRSGLSPPRPVRYIKYQRHHELKPHQRPSIADNEQSDEEKDPVPPSEMPASIDITPDGTPSTSYGHAKTESTDEAISDDNASRSLKSVSTIHNNSMGGVRADDDDGDVLSGWNTISGVAGQSLERELSDDDDDIVSALGANRDLKDAPHLTAERSSIMKTITSLWTGNAANFLPLETPLAPTEHIFPDSNLVVREDEPSSIIAFTLDSKHYKEKLRCMRQGGADSTDKLVPASATPTGMSGISNASGLPSSGPTTPTAASLLSVTSPSTTNTHDESQTRVVVEIDDAYGDTAAGTEETLLRGTGTHIRYQFWDGPTRMNCKIFFAEQFEALRRNCGIDDQFVQSLARCMRWDALGGKSGSQFLKTRDDRLLIKQLSRVEMDALYKFAPAYFEYMSQAIFHDLPTVLAKILGFYRISYKNPTTGKSMRFDCFVMENLFYERKIARIFDLKGSMRNRHVQSTGRQNEVLLDENLVEFIYESPLFIREHSKKLLRASLWNDTLFLSKLNVMDYSLLVGIDAERSELVVGIVDYIRTFTWDKKLESWVKESAFLGGGGKEPTIISPRQYKNRFREAMERYFLMVPDKFITSLTPAQAQVA
ncbi:hypothetical protein DFS34DRAFT_634485 [Phlyctochytrium arcticum]|nr:hypothetical protein DFS34DRAFT_634485 [Phlyctochytrium arcticum]